MQISTILIIYFLRNWLFSQSVNCKYLHSGAGNVTDNEYNTQDRVLTYFIGDKRV